MNYPIENTLTDWLQDNDLPVDPSEASREIATLKKIKAHHRTLYKEYAVTWQIEVIALNAREAAEEALTIMRDPNGKAQFFEVTEKGQDSIFIDLLENEG